MREDKHVWVVRDKELYIWMIFGCLEDAIMYRNRNNEISQTMHMEITEYSVM